MPGPNDKDFIADAARRHGLSEGATRAVWDALRAGNGYQAQFSHPELGGMGQWSGGMLQIGDMFNSALKAKVAAVCADLAGHVAEAAATGWGSGSHQSQRQGDGSSDAVDQRSRRDWWPDGLGQPSSTGSQNDTRYALFPASRRLAIQRNGTVSVFDTGDHVISGFSQAQSGGSTMAFTSQLGAVWLDELRRIDG